MRIDDVEARPRWLSFRCALAKIDLTVALTVESHAHFEFFKDGVDVGLNLYIYNPWNQQRVFDACQAAAKAEGLAWIEFCSP